MDVMATSGVADRLREALRRANLTQSEFADRLGTSQGAVSQWLSGTKQLSGRNLVMASEVLKAELDWLARGYGSPPEPDLTIARSEYETETGWCFRPVPPDLGRDYGNANLWTLPWTIDTLVRESGQNSIDETRDLEAGIDMEYSLILLKGTDLEQFLKALGWEDSQKAPGLKSHILASTQNTQKLARILQDGLTQLETQGEMMLLRVDDYGTYGLRGEEFGSGNFAALTRNNLDSNKAGNGTAGGAFGLGKAVFTRASRFATVLYNSNLSEPERLAGGEEQEGRVIGRADLTWHEVGHAGQFAGPGWFGNPEQTPQGMRAVSVWNNPALINDLYLKRKGTEPGTSIMVVNFYDPSGDTPTTITQLAEDIAASAARNFWPALASGRLRVRVTTYEGKKETSSRDVDAERYQAPFVDALRKYRQGETSESLAGPGDVVQKRIQLKIPRRKAQSNPHSEITHEAVLLVRRADEDASDDLLRNASFFRGREMVITYASYKSLIVGAPPFHAVVLCGEAVGDGDEDDRAAERFLRTAEPPAHNTWELTPELKADYVPGSGYALRKFFDDVREQVREIVRPQYKDLDEGPQSLRELLKIAADPAPTSAAPKIYVDRASTYVDDQGRWVVHGIIKVPDNSNWRITPALKFAAETGSSKRVDWSLEPLSGCTVFGDDVDIPGGVREAHFKGISNPDTHPVPAYESAIEVAIQHARKVGGEL